MIPIHRFEDQIRAYEELPAETGKVLLYGSSFFAFWGYDRAKKQCAEATKGELEVVNHGFGGATVEELLYYYHRMVLPYAPKAIVFRTGFNDMPHMSPEECMVLTRRLFDWAKNDFPGVKLIAIKGFDNPSAVPEHLVKLRQYNQMLDNLAEKDAQLMTLDLNSFFYQSSADIGTCQNFRDVFREDGLHLTDRGYEEMANYLAQNIKNLLQTEGIGQRNVLNI